MGSNIEPRISLDFLTNTSQKCQIVSRSQLSSEAWHGSVPRGAWYCCSLFPPGWQWKHLCKKQRHPPHSILRESHHCGGSNQPSTTHNRNLSGPRSRSMPIWAMNPWPGKTCVFVSEICSKIQDCSRCHPVDSIQFSACNLPVHETSTCKRCQAEHQLLST